MSLRKLLLFPFFFTLVCILPSLTYLLSEFIFRANTSGQCMSCEHAPGLRRAIPLYVHQIFFQVTGNEIPEKFRELQQSWTRLNPEFKYILWNASMVDDLIDENYPEIKELYLSYGHWTNRVDVARMLVLHQYGGVYADIDVGCKKPLRNLFTKMDNRGVLLYSGRLFGVANAFIVSEARSSFLEFAIGGLQNAQRWFVLPHFTVLFSTGPLFLSGRYYNYKQKNAVLIVPREKIIDNYISHKMGCSWCGWDTFILVSIFGYGHWARVVTVMCFIFLGITLVRKCLCKPTHLN